MKGFANKDLVAAVKRSKAKKTFLDWCGPEDHFQHSVIVWIQLQYPNLRYHHSPNEGRRTPFEQFRFKYLGSDAGFPDLLFVSLRLVIELKIKPNRPTPDQLYWLEYFKSIGWRAEVCYTFEEVKKVIEEELNKLIA